MEVSFLSFLAGAFGLALFALLGIWWVLVRRLEKRRAARATELLRKGASPIQVQQHLIAEGLDRQAAAKSVQTALGSTTHPSDASQSGVGTTTATAPSDSSATPHERGVAHLKRREYAEAVAAFTEAIALEPDAPNSYLGRAVAYRRLENLSGALQDETTAEKLGGPEKTAWDRLVNRSRQRWSWDFDNSRWRQSDPLSRQAVLLCMLNRQILNGGLLQWIANGYGRWIEDVIEAAREVGTDAAKEVAAVLEVVAHHLEGWYAVGDRQEDAALDEEGDFPEEPDELSEVLSGCEDRYYQVQSQFVRDVETWLEERATAPGRRMG
jgi:hypothetical protein